MDWQAASFWTPIVDLDDPHWDFCRYCTYGWIQNKGKIVKALKSQSIKNSLWSHLIYPVFLHSVECL